MSERTAEQTSRIGQAAADAGEEIARAGANAFQQNAETLQNAWRFGLDVATSVMGRSTDQLGRTLGLSGNEAEQATERSARNAEAILFHCRHQSDEWDIARVLRIRSTADREQYEPHERLVAVPNSAGPCSRPE
jgi:hypothetical protein